MVGKSILNNSLNQVIKDYRLSLEKAGVPVEKMILFGSRARGRGKEWSDVDLCVVSKIFGRDYFEEMVRLKKLAADVEPMIEPHPFTPEDLKNRFDPLTAEILAHGKTV